MNEIARPFSLHGALAFREGMRRKEGGSVRVGALATSVLLSPFSLLPSLQSCFVALGKSKEGNEAFSPTELNDNKKRLHMVFNER